MFRMDTNPGNVLVINFDDVISDDDIREETNMNTIVNGWLETYFGSSIYTPKDYVCSLFPLPLSSSPLPLLSLFLPRSPSLPLLTKFVLQINDQNQWPTGYSLSIRGKSLILNTNGHTFGGKYVHEDLRGIFLSIIY